jgi:hypothetical protein
MYKIINSLKKIFIEILKVNKQNNPMLGRWCHVNVPNCNYDVLLKKIDMANRDNNFCIKPKTLKKE